MTRVLNIFQVKGENSVDLSYFLLNILQVITNVNLCTIIINYPQSELGMKMQLNVINSAENILNLKFITPQQNISYFSDLQQINIIKRH